MCCRVGVWCGWLLICQSVFAQVAPQATGKPGEPIIRFQAVKVAGPSDAIAIGTFADYTNDYGNRPLAIVFARKADDRLAGLITALEEALVADETKQKCAYVVIYDKDRDSSEAMAKRFCEGKSFPQVPIVFPNTAEAAFRSYGLSATADATVVVAVEAKVLSHYAGALHEGAVKKTLDNLEKAKAKAVLAAEEQKRRSGLQKGVQMMPYFAARWSGADSAIEVGQETSWRCRYGGSPQVAVFARKVNDNVVSLVKQLDAAMEKHEKRNMHAYLTLLGPKEQVTEQAKEFAAKYEISRLPIVVPADSDRGPADLLLNPEIDVTVMVLHWNTEVAANFAVRADDIDEEWIKRVMREVNQADDKPTQPKVITNRRR